MVHTNKVIILLDKQAYTEEPYKKIFNKEEFPIIAAAPTINIPVPKKET